MVQGMAYAVPGKRKAPQGNGRPSVGNDPSAIFPEQVAHGKEGGNEEGRRLQTYSTGSSWGMKGDGCL